MVMFFLSSWLLRLLSSIPTSILAQQTTTTTDPSPDSTVILGSGVIGLSTAYYLALLLNETVPPPLRPPVVVIEQATGICPGASRGATGGLGDFVFSDLTARLGTLSYALHQELSSNYDGQRRWGFRDQNVFRVTPKDFTGSLSPPDSWGSAPPVDKDVFSLPPWIQLSDDWAVQLLAQGPHGAHLDPARFCQFLYDRCTELGVQFRFNSAVTAVQRAHDTGRFTSVTVQTRTPARTITEVIPCNAVVIAAGPWSARVLSNLFPDARMQLSMNTTWTSGNHVRVRNPQWTPDDDGDSSQVFLNNVLPGSKTLDITSYAGGSLYLGGWGATPESHCPTAQRT